MYLFQPAFAGGNRRKQKSANQRKAPIDTLKIPITWISHWKS
jgi:hypothetical protein